MYLKNDFALIKRNVLNSNCVTFNRSGSNKSLFEDYECHVNYFPHVPLMSLIRASFFHIHIKH